MKDRALLTYKERLFSLLIVFCSLYFVSCGEGGRTWTWGEAVKYFDYEIQGTWESADKSVYSGRLEIRNETVTITGYAEGQTPATGGNDLWRPFRDYTKGVALRGYDESGMIYVRDGGAYGAGLAYRMWYEDNYGYGRVWFLRFEFGGRTETLRRLNYE
jgi:hypothetical protein